MLSHASQFFRITVFFMIPQDGAGAGFITNSASVDSCTPDVDLANNFATITVPTTVDPTAHPGPVFSITVVLSTAPSQEEVDSIKF